MTDSNLVIIVGQEGAGKSTTVRALAPGIPWSARIDAEDLSYVNPWGLDELRLNLLWKNVADLTRNYWAAGFRNVVAGSFLSNIDHYHAFRGLLHMPANVYVIQLCAGKPVRDVRRIERPKSSTADWRDHVDRIDPEDRTFAATSGDYRYLRIDNDDIDVDASVDLVRQWAPNLFEGRHQQRRQGRTIGVVALDEFRRFLRRGSLPGERSIGTVTPLWILNEQR